MSKSTVITLGILVVQIALPIFGANEAKNLVTREYHNGENRYFHAETNDCNRCFCLYPQLWCYSPLTCCCIGTPEQGKELVEEFMNAQKKTCQGVTINTTNFEPRHAKVMLETIKVKQAEDLEHYYQRRAVMNPEKKYTDCMRGRATCGELSFLNILSAYKNHKTNSLQKKLPPDTPEESIETIASVQTCPCSNSELCCLFIACDYLCLLTENL